MIKINSAVLLPAVFICSLLMSCAADRKMARQVNRLFKESEAFKNHHVGFAMYNLSERQLVYAHNADKYFTPASNTKLFTFYAGLRMLGDSIPGLRYVERGDSIIFWGTGDPSLLHSKLRGTKVFDFLKKTEKQLFFSPGRYTGSFYGKGWQWDDYNDYYQAEINELPLLDNLIGINVVKGGINVSPRLFKDCFNVDSSLKDTVFSVKRDFLENRFRYPIVQPKPFYRQQIPYKTGTSTSLSLLADTLDKEIGIIDMKMPPDAKTIYSLARDSVLKEMMLPSDNFIAEQLLLLYANQIGVELSAEKAIGYIENNYLTSLPDKVRWVDGSGLSRYNLFTPRDIIALLEMIYQEADNPEKLFAMLPAGGKTGTLLNAYPKTDRPFVFGKTGSFSNNYNQSGYLVTRKKKTYLFSCMNNNFLLPAGEIRKEIARIMTIVYERF